MNIKKIVLACVAVSLLYGGDAFAGSENSKTRKSVKELAEKFGGQAKIYQKPNTNRGPNARNRKNAKRNAEKKEKDELIRISEAISVLRKMKQIELEDIPANLFSGGKTGTYKDVGSEFGTHIQNVWNLSSDATANSEEISALLDDLTNTATIVALSEGDIEGRKDAQYDFSAISEDDFQGIIAKNDFSKAFYFNAIAKISHILHKGTEGHVFWHGMFKVMVKLLVTDHYLLTSR